MLTLNVNIDHVATVRQARGGSEPDPITAALNAELAGASGIVSHLREDRRHVNDRDVALLRQTVQTKLDLEMAAAKEIIDIALDLVPDLVTIVPEKRQELTTEGGLNVAADVARFTELSSAMHSKNIEVSYFIEPDEKQIKACLEAGADMVELHTGTYANARSEKEISEELARFKDASSIAFENGLKIAAGHGLNYENVKPICLIPEINELSIGHSIIARSIYVGITQAVREMLTIMNSVVLMRPIV